MKRILKDLLLIGLLFVALFGLLSLFWTQHLWGDVDIEQIFINMQEGLPEVSKQVLRGYIIAFAASLVISFLLGMWCKYRYLAGLVCIFSGIIVWQLEIIPYFLNKHIYTDLYEREYVAPESIEYTFPQKKRNLIVIYLESMEKDYTNSQLVGTNLLPKLSKYINHDLSFDGYHQLRHQDYTIAGKVNSMCAIAYRTHIFAHTNEYYTFLDDAVCYPQILKQNGYRTYFMKGANIKFARTGIFLQKHGFDDIAGKYEIEDTYHIPLQDYIGAFAGYQDRVLFDLIKSKLTEIAADPRPFLFMTTTLDTHFPDIYLDKSCTSSDSKTKDVIRCSDKMVAELLDWIQHQPFYDNTTIVVISDHIQTGRNALYPKNDNRQIVNFILNPADPKLKPVPHTYTMLDVAPTILNAIGVTFEGGKFGLGRSLLASTPTLFEQMGNNLDLKIAQASHIYEKFEQNKNVIRPTYQAYGPWGTTVQDLAQIQSYAIYSNTLLDGVYLSEMSFTLPSDTPQDLMMTVRFKTMLNKQKKRHIKAIAGGIIVDDWNFSPQDKQPITKQIRIPHSALDGNHLAIEFLADDPFVETLSIGVMSFKIEEQH